MSQELNFHLPYGPSVLPKGVYLREMNLGPHTDLDTNVLSSMLCNIQTLEPTSVSSSRGTGGKSVL